MSFVKRTVCPSKDNKYYIQDDHGGWSPCVLGKDSSGNRSTGGWVLPNCVGYAVGRFNEIGNYKKCKYLKSVNAEDMLSCVTAQGLKTGQTPKEGACMVWRDGPYSGCGHVAIVETVISPNEIVTSESGWKGGEFWTRPRTNDNGNWGAESGYEFLEFIYHPDVTNSTLNQTASGFVGDGTPGQSSATGMGGGLVKYNAKYSKYSVIDVSEHQGKLDWDSIKTTSVKRQKDQSSLPPIKAAIIRLGYGSGLNYPSHSRDSMVMYHINGCVKNNIPFGLYWFVSDYGSAPTMSGQNTAKIMLDFYNELDAEAKRLCQLPLYLDIEDSSYTSPKFDGLNTELAAEYCKYILTNGGGLIPGIYAAVGHCGTYINDVGKAIDDNVVSFSYIGADGNTTTKNICKGDLLYSKWLARWTTNENLLSGNYKHINPPIAFWQQYGDDKDNYAEISCHNAHVDINNCFIDYVYTATPVAVGKDELAETGIESTPFVLYFTTDSGGHYYLKAENKEYNTVQWNNTPSGVEFYSKAVSVTSELSEAVVLYVGKKTASGGQEYYLYYVDGNNVQQKLRLQDVIAPTINSQTGTCFYALFGPDLENTANPSAPIDNNSSFVIQELFDSLQWGDLQLRLVADGVSTPIESTATLKIGANNAKLAKVTLSSDWNATSSGGVAGDGAILNVTNLLDIDDSISRELIITCLEDYYTVDPEDYKNSTETDDDGNIICLSIEEFENALASLRGLLSQAIIPMESATTMIDWVANCFSQLVLKDTAENLEEYREVVQAFVSEKNSITELNLSDYTESTAATATAAIEKAAYLPVPDKNTSGELVFSDNIKTALNNYKLSEFKKHTKSLENARKTLVLKELNKDLEVECEVNGKTQSISFNKLQELIQNLNEEDFTEATYTELMANYVDKDFSSIGQSELNELITEAVAYISSSLCPALADCTEFFRARLKAAARRDYARKEYYAQINPDASSTWSLFANGESTGAENDYTADYKLRYTAASRERVDALCDIFDLFVELDTTKLTSNFPALNSVATICLQSEIDQLTHELNEATDNLVTEMSTMADQYLEKYSELAECTYSIGVKASAKLILVELLRNLYTSDFSIANEETLKQNTEELSEVLAQIQTGDMLIYLPADYSALDQALAIAATLNNRRFTTESFNNLTDTVATAKKNTNYSDSVRKTYHEQRIVDRAAESVRTAIANLKVKEEPLTLTFTSNTSGANVDEYQWVLLPNSLQSGWNELILPFVAGVATGTPDTSALNWFRMYTSAGVDLTVIIDDISVVEYTETEEGVYQAEGASVSLWNCDKKNSSGVSVYNRNTITITTAEGEVKEGTAAYKNVGSTNDERIVLKFNPAKDASAVENGALHLWLYFEDASKLTGNVYFELGSGNHSADPDIQLNVENKIIKENIDVTISVYTAGKIYYIDDINQLKQGLLLNPGVYFKFRSILKNNTMATDPIETWQYTYYVTNTDGDVIATTQNIAIRYGCVYKSTEAGPIEIWTPNPDGVFQE